MLPWGVFLCFRFFIVLCFSSTAIFSCRNPPAGAEGRWLWHLWVSRGEKSGPVTSHCELVMPTSNPRPSGLNNEAWEGQVERTGDSSDITSVQWAPVVALTAAVRIKGLSCCRVVPLFCLSASSLFSPSSDSSQWCFKTELICFFFFPLSSLGLFDCRGISHWDARHERQGVGAWRVDECCLDQ